MTIYAVSYQENDEKHVLVSETLPLLHQKMASIKGKLLHEPIEAITPAYVELDLQQPLMSEVLLNDGREVIILANNKSDLDSMRLEIISDVFDEKFPDAEYEEDENGDTHLSASWQDKFGVFSDDLESEFEPAKTTNALEVLEKEIKSPSFEI